MDLAKIRKKLREARQKAESDAAAAAGNLPSEDAAPQSGEASNFSGHQQEVKALPAEIGLSGQDAPETGAQAGIDQGPQDSPDSFETLSLDEIASEKPGEEETPDGAADGLQPQPEADSAALETQAGRPETEQSVIAAAPPEAAAGAEADEAEKEKIRQKNVEILTFRLGGEDYAFRIEDIEEILKPQQVTRVPRMQAYITGISSLRGKIIPVMDLKIRLGLKGNGLPEKLARVLILRGPQGSIGVNVDMVEDVLRIPTSLVQEPPSHLSDIEVKYLEGVALYNGKFISIMKTGEVLSVRDAV